MAPTMTSTMPTSSHATMPASRSQSGATTTRCSSLGSISRTSGSSAPAGSPGTGFPRLILARIMSRVASPRAGGRASPGEGDLGAHERWHDRTMAELTDEQLIGLLDLTRGADSVELKL